MMGDQSRSIHTKSFLPVIVTKTYCCLVERVLYYDTAERVNEKLNAWLNEFGDKIEIVNLEYRNHEYHNFYIQDASITVRYRFTEIKSVD